MKIKTVCERTGLSDRAVRYYIEEGLISPGYTENYLGRKAFSFSEEDIAALQDIAILRKFGFSISDIQEMIADPLRIIPLVRNLQQQKEHILTEETALLRSLLSIEEGEYYTISRLAAKLSAPVEHKEVPPEDNASRFWWKFGKTCLFIPFAFFPVLHLCIGFCYLFHDAILNHAANILYYILSPLALCLLAHFFVFNRKGRVLYIGCIITTAVFCTLSLFFDVCAESVLVKNYDGPYSGSLYSAFAEDNPLLPDLQEVAEFSDPEYYKVSQESSIFYWETTCFIFSYTPEQYEAQKAALDHHYIFQSEAIREGDYICEPIAELDGYVFRFLSPEEYDKTLDYPKNIMLIGYSDQKREIIYMIYMAPDMDYIGDLSHFVLNFCGWKYMNRGSLYEE